MKDQGVLERIANSFEQIATSVQQIAQAHTVGAVVKNPKPKATTQKAGMVEVEVTTGTGETPTIDDLIVDMKKYAAVEGKDAMRALLKEFGATTASEVKASDRAAIMVRCNS